MQIDEIMRQAQRQRAFEYAKMLDEKTWFCIRPRPGWLPKWIWNRILQRLLFLGQFSYDAPWNKGPMPPHTKGSPCE